MFRFLVVLFFIGTWIHAAEIVPIEQDDSRVTPDFAALGQMHQVAGLIWSGVALNTMNYTDAIRFCKTLGGKARLPTKEDWIHLGRVMTRQSEIFNPELYKNFDPEEMYYYANMKKINNLHLNNNINFLHLIILIWE